MRIGALGAAAGCLLLLGGGALSRAHAEIGDFEIKEPKVEAGEVELEYRGDYQPGQPRRRFLVDPSGALLADDNAFTRQRHSLGVGYGLTKWLKLQLTLQAEQARADAPATVADLGAFEPLKITEIGIEGTIVLLPARNNALGVALLIEHDIAFDRHESDQLLLGTALQYGWGLWTATLDLYAVKHLGGREELNGARIRDERWDLQYAARIKYKWSDNLELALEAFGVPERLGDSGTKSDERVRFGDFDRHLVGPVIYYSWGGNDVRPAKTGKGLKVRGAGADGRAGGDDDKSGGSDAPRYTLGAGVLFGLNGNTSDVALKWAFSVEF